MNGSSCSASEALPFTVPGSSCGCTQNACQGICIKGHVGNLPVPGIWAQNCNGSIDIASLHVPLCPS